MTYEVSIDSAIGIDGDDGDDSKYGMDVFVEDNHSTTSSNVKMTSENLGNIETIRQKQISHNL